MRPIGTSARERVEGRLWPLLGHLVATLPVAGLAVAVVSGSDVVARGFGVRDVTTAAPVTPETMFHLASVSQPFVATAIGHLAGSSRLDLDAPITGWIPEFTLADGRASEVTARMLLSHTSGLPDVTEYGWHEPQLADSALADFAASRSGWRLRTEPGAAYAYSNAGFELLGLVLSRVVGTTFEDAMRAYLLRPIGMPHSTFRRGEVPAHLAAAPHVGMPLTVAGDAYPYTRRHAPSSTLHSSAVEMASWIRACLDPVAIGDGSGHSRELLEALWRPVVAVGEPPWVEQMGLGWGLGSYRGERTVGHSGADPGFGSRLVIVPDRRVGVVVLANSNTVPTSAICAAALDVVLPEPAVDAHPDAVAALSREVTGAPDDDLDDEEHEKAVWGAIELHRTDLAWPLLRVWTAVRPESAQAWTMTGWAHQVDGDLAAAAAALRRALDLDPAHGEAAQLLDILGPQSENDHDD